MNIGIFNPYLDSLTGGEKYILTLAYCLLQELHNVTIFWDDNSILDRAEDKFGLDLSGVLISENIFSIKISIWKRLLESKKYDAIIILSDGSIPLVLSKLFVHFQFPVEWVNGRSLKNRFKMSRVTQVFCNSKFTKNYIDNNFGIISELLYPPIENKVKNLPKENIILTVGRFGITNEGTNYKKHDVLIKSFKKMVGKKIKNWNFILVVSLREEDAERFKKLQSLAEGFPIEFIINPSSQILWEWYSRSKIYWHASGFGEDLENHPENAEHFGMSTVEAMSAGAIPVVINAGGQREIIDSDKNGYLWNTIDELITFTKQLMNSEDTMKKLSVSAQKKALNFNAQKFKSKALSMIHI
ncbi:MAG: glycosyltransferase [Candidatus Levybacteria bacterium]|nr:glycosyltransferase [Candidatus Levybacteria bacterium]